MGIMGGRKDGATFRRYVCHPVCRNALTEFTLESVGPDAPDHISCMAMDGDAVWAASGIYAIKYLRGKEVSEHLKKIGRFSVYLLGTTRLESSRYQSLVYNDLWCTITGFGRKRRTLAFLEYLRWR